MSNQNDSPAQEQTFVSHLVELRDRLLRIVLAVLIIFLCLFYFANDIYELLAEPLIRQLPKGSGMIATGVISPFLTPFKLTLVVSVFIAIPFILYQMWAFIAPGLYQHERKLVYPLLFSSTVLFYLGMTFAYFVVFPLVFGFIATTTPEGVAQAPDIALYLDFALKLFFAFGIAFEVPIATILVIWSGLTTAESLKKKRPYIIVAAFVVGMLLTPPDIISQTLLALPMWILFELGLIMSKMYTRKEVEDEENSDSQQTQTATDSEKPASETAGSNAGGIVDEEYHELSEAEMDAELDRIEEEEDFEHDPIDVEDSTGRDDYDDHDDIYDNEDGEIHEEYEPIPEERDDAKKKRDDKDTTQKE